MRHGDQEVAADLQNSVPVGQSTPRIIDMLQHVTAKHGVLATLRKRQGPAVVAGIIEIDSDRLFGYRLALGISAAIADVEDRVPRKVFFEESFALPTLLILGRFWSEMSSHDAATRVLRARACSIFVVAELREESTKTRATGLGAGPLHRLSASRIRSSSESALRRSW